MGEVALRLDTLADSRTRDGIAVVIEALNGRLQEQQAEWLREG
jgi:predicted transcriptional regulator